MPSFCRLNDMAKEIAESKGKGNWIEMMKVCPAWSACKGM